MSTRLLLLFALLFLSGLCAVAEEEPPAARPPTPAEAAAEVQRALEAADDAALTRAAARSQPDPWLVVDHLLSEQAHDAGAAFAKAVPDREGEALRTYVARERKRATDEEDRQIFAAVLAATIQGDAEAAIEAARDLTGELDSVPRVRTRLLHGLAFERLQRSGEAGLRLYEAARGAEGIGWLATALPAYARAVQHARLHTDWRLGVRALERVMAIQERLGQVVARAWTLGNLGVMLERLAEYDRALECQEKALALLEGHEEQARIRPVVLGNVGNIHIRRGDYELAQKTLSESLALMIELGDAAGEARVLGSIAALREQEGHLQEALKIHEDLVEQHRKRDDVRAYALTLGNVAQVRAELGDFPRARAAYEKALEIRKALDEPAGIAHVLGNMAVMYQHMGDHAEAMSLHTQALTLKRQVGDRAGEAATLANMGLLHLDLGDFARALGIQERVLELMKSIGDTPGIARVHAHLGNIHLTLGGYEQALAFHRKALEISRRLGNRGVEAELLQSIGIAYMNQERYDDCLRVTREALALHAQIGDKQGTASCLTRLGELQHRRQKHADAIATLRRAETLFAQLGDETRAAWAAYRIGVVLADQGKLDESLQHAQRAVREMRALRSNNDLLDGLELLATVQFRRKEHARALGTAREAMHLFERALAGLAEIEGARARDRHADLYGVGVRCAQALGEPEEALTFLEASRSGSLLHALSSSPTRLHVPIELPADLRKARQQADARHRAAEEALRRATRREDHTAEVAARKELRTAEAELSALLARIQRDAKRQASVLYPRPRTLRQIREKLEPGDVLVMYGLCLDRALALVIDAATARIADLGSADEVRRSCAACTTDDPDEKVGTAIDDLRQRIVAPLGLAGTAKRVIVSPSECLCYVPFAALFPDRPVVLTPSGTTHVHLGNLPVRHGREVLALGGPRYGVNADPSAVRVYARGGVLAPLPKSKEEAEAVGDTVLTGEHATEAELEAVLATRPRWRAVHIACHGRVDTERPVFSSLALTRAGDDDGFLTCYEILGMSIPADLVVLSACATAKGQMWRSEGIIGLTRAFMYAGTPRVLCSLWKVDDEATKALMVRFYELWNPPRDADGKPARPPLPAQEALRQAQAHVRAQPAWEHPYYWAAWVLWGLPE